MSRVTYRVDNSPYEYTSLSVLLDAGYHECIMIVRSGSYTSRTRIDIHTEQAIGDTWTA